MQVIIIEIAFLSFQVMYTGMKVSVIYFETSWNTVVLDRSIKIIFIRNYTL